MQEHNPYRKPNGRRWTVLRQAVFAQFGRTCHLCGHDGANQVDHLVPHSVNPALGWVLDNLRPVHGVPGNRCPVCHVACNQARQAGQVRPRQMVTAPVVREHASYCEAEPDHQWNCGRRW